MSVLDDHLTLLAGILAERSSLNGDTDKFFLFPKAAATYKLPIAEDLFNPIRVRAAYGEAGNRPNYGAEVHRAVGGQHHRRQPGPRRAGQRRRPGRSSRSASARSSPASTSRWRTRSSSLELTAYQRSISNLLLQRALPTSTGFGTEF